MLSGRGDKGRVPRGYSSISAWNVRSVRSSTQPKLRGNVPTFTRRLTREVDPRFGEVAEVLEAPNRLLRAVRGAAEVCGEGEGPVPRPACLEETVSCHP